MGLQGCGEEGMSEENPEQNALHQFMLTLVILLVVCACNFMYWHRRQIAAYLARRGTKRPHSEVDDVMMWNLTRRQFPLRKQLFQAECIALELVQEEVGAQVVHKMNPNHRSILCYRRCAQVVWDVWSPEWFTYWMLGRVNQPLHWRGNGMSPEEKQRYLSRQNILGSQLVILDENNDQATREQAFRFCMGI